MAVDSEDPPPLGFLHTISLPQEGNLHPAAPDEEERSPQSICPHRALSEQNSGCRRCILLWQTIQVHHQLLSLFLTVVIDSRGDDLLQASAVSIPSSKYEYRHLLLHKNQKNIPICRWWYLRNILLWTLKVQHGFMRL